VSYAKDDRVFVRPLGVMGTVTRVRADGQYAVMADCAAQNVVWSEADLGEPGDAGPGS
jgi:hypothetical protein